jgi:hypothetical protein
VRVGSALFDQLCVDDDCKERHYAQSSLSDQTLCARITELQSETKLACERMQEKELEVESLHRDLRDASARNEILRCLVSDSNESVLRYQTETDRLLSRLNDLTNRSSAISLGIAAIPETFSRCTETGLECGSCRDLRAQIERNQGSAKEAERLGAELTTTLEERDKLKSELRRLKGGQSQERIKTILKENDHLKEALKKRFPPNFSSLLNVSNVPESQSDKDTIRQLESKIERIEDQWTRRLDTLRANADDMRNEYEKTICSLAQKRQAVNPKLIVESHSPKQNMISIELNHETQVLRKRVQDLESRIESMKNYYLLKQKRAPTVSKMMRPIVQRIGVIQYSPLNLSYDAVDCPPLPQKDVTLSEWVCLLRSIDPPEHRLEIADEMVQSDFRKNGLIDRSSFLRALAPVIPREPISVLIDVYAFGDDQVDYKAFLSDLATRHNVFSVDLETENRKLRGHVDALMRELKERIESIEGGSLMQSLENANEELSKRENELKLYKTELSRFLTRNIHHISQS